MGAALSRLLWRAAGRLYDVVDAVYRRWHRLEGVGELFYVGRMSWRGPPRTLADGTEIAPGDALARLHFNNQFLASDGGDPNGAAGVMRFASRFFPAFRALARKLSEEPAWRDVAAVYAISWVPPQAERFGFEFQRLPEGLRTRWIRWHIANLMMVANPEAGRRQRRRLWPVEIWLSRARLLERFLGEQQPR